MRKIAVFTGTRAEYGLLYWTIRALSDSEQAQLILIAGGMHLSPEFGYTIKNIEADGFIINEKIDFLLSTDTPIGVSKSMALALIGLAEALERQKPDILVLLGDRFESMAAAQAAMIANIPVAHIHGGETTEGLIDEAVRHSISKMSHLHFTATETYRNRVIQLGEQPDFVFNVGAPGLDSIKKLTLMKKNQLTKSINFNISSPFFLVTFHPVTLNKDSANISIKNLFQALNHFEKYKIIITYPNADMFGREIIHLMEDYAIRNKNRVLLTKSLGQVRYLSLLKYCSAVIGNSSSGLIEAPSFHTPTVNIGNRQKGRISGDTVIHCNEDYQDIKNAIHKAICKKFKRTCKNSKNPYDNGNSSEKIINALLHHPLDNILIKKFNDIY